MTTAQISDLEALVGRFLLPGAPQELVEAVRSLFEEQPSLAASGVSPHTTTNGHHGPLPERNPWEVLHVSPCAPAEVVDLAYRLWRSEHRPVSERIAPGPRPDAVPHFAPPDARARLTERSPPADAPPSTTNDVVHADAYLETASGENRFAIDHDSLRIGTAPMCDISVPDRGTPVEARIWPKRGRYMLHVASGSVHLNNLPAVWAVLDDGDMLEVGDVMFRFRHDAAP